MNSGPECIPRLFELLVDTQTVPVDPSTDSNHELDKILKSHNLLILKIAEVVKSTKSRNLVQNPYGIFFTSQQVLQSLTKLIRNGKAKGRLMAAGFRWVDGSYLSFVEPRLIGNLDVVSVRVADVCREVVGTPFGPKARFLV